MMGTVQITLPECVRRQKLSDSLKGRRLSEEHKRKLSEAQNEWIRIHGHQCNGYKQSEEHKRKIFDGHKEWLKIHGSPMKGRKHSEETKRKMSRAQKGKTLSEEHKKRILDANKSRILSEEARKKMSESHQGPNNHNWQGGISFESYCPKFNDRLKEKIRNRNNRVCVLCGKSEILNGKRLSVHHIDSDKLQGCNGKRWYLCTLCCSCNSKKDTIEKEFLIVTNLPTSLVGSGV